MPDKDRGRRAGFDPASGEVGGSGSGAGGGNPGEDYDRDPMTGSGAKPPHGTGHPLPASDEARHGEIPEGLAADKGCGDDSPAAVHPGDEAVGPDGESYRFDDRAGDGHGAPRE
jgi:hypothetical protein